MLSLLVIRTTQLSTVVDFYELFLPDFQYHRHGNGPYHYSTELGQMVFEIYPLQQNQLMTDTSTRLGFQVQNLDDLLEKLNQQGRRIVSSAKTSPWGYRAVVADPDGRKVELTEVSESNTSSS